MPLNTLGSVVEKREALLRGEVADLGNANENLSVVLQENNWEVCVPLVGEGILGVLFLGPKRYLEAYTAGDLDLLNVVGTQASIALENARLYGELRKSQEVIQRTGRLSAIGTLAAGIAHEIRNPLVSIQTFFQLAPSRVNDEEFLTSFLKLTEGEVKRICDLITDLLNFARSPTHSLSRLFINEEVEKVLTLLAPQARSQHLTVDLDLGKDLPPVMGCCSSRRWRASSPSWSSSRRWPRACSSCIRRHCASRSPAWSVAPGPSSSKSPIAASCSSRGVAGPRGSAADPGCRGRPFEAIRTLERMALSDARKAELTEKIAAGERLTRAGRRGPLRLRRPGLARRAGARRADREERRRGLLQRQPAPQPDQRLHRVLRVLQLPAQARPEGRVHDARRGGRREGAGDEGRRAHRAAHRQRPAPDAAVEVLPARAARAEGGAAARSRSRRSPPPRCTASRRSPGCRADEILDELIDAGLESLTGGGAEIFDWDVRKQIVDHKTHWEDWSRIHRLAHQKGLRTPATMLYGHIEEPRHRVDHVLRLRELQDETGGFQVFIPLRFHNDNNRLSHLPMAQPADVLQDLRGVAADARQLRARQGVLGDARAVDLAARAELRRRRHGRLGRRVQDHPRRRRLRHAGQADPRRPARPHPRRRVPRPKERNTRYEVHPRVRRARCRWPSAAPSRRPSGREASTPSASRAADRRRQPSRPSFASWMGSLWGYTILRFGMFFALWGLLVLVGLRRPARARCIALVLSVPLSLVLLAGPRARVAQNVERRVDAAPRGAGRPRRAARSRPPRRLRTRLALAPMPVRHSRSAAISSTA